MINYPRIKYVSKVKVEGLLRQQNKGQFFGLRFIKKDGSLRVMNARLGIKPVRNGRKTVGTADQPYLVVFSTNDLGYRAVNLETLLTITMGGTLYYVR